ncbi:MAG: pyridoxal phosphate-dependent aminotransferase [Oscillospiraceae bacterium]|jgi:aspartate aminotransferase|nr:pyridoxal phosphate-dependent aminotransferase [Oscillospiraceae bacterium]
MISEKMIKLAQNNTVIRAMFEEGKRMAEQYGSDNVYDFSLGNPNFPSPPAIKDAITGIVAGVDPVLLHGYMSNAGFPDVRRTVADSLNLRIGSSYDENNIIMSVGAAGGLNVVLKTLLNPGDEVIAISPFFVEYGNYVGNFDGKLVIVPANADNFQPDPELIRSAITPKTKAIIINSPNNPTGVIYSEDTIRQLSAVLTDKEREYGISIYLLSDEPYRELAYDGADVPYLTKFYRNTIVCYSWSKSLSLPGERIGYILVPGQIDEYSLVFDAACIATRILGFVNAPSLMQMAVAKCLDEKTDIKAYDENRKLLYEGLIGCGFSPVYPQGAFYMWVKTPCDDKDFAAAAKKHNILIVPGASFACPGYVRIAYCVAKKTIEGSMPGFRKLAAEYGLGGGK